MAIRLTGLTSGLDTDSIVQELVSAYATKKESIEKKQTKLEWTMNAWKDINSKVYGFYTSTLSSMRYSSSYNLRTATISNSSVAQVSASTGAVTSSQTLAVKQLAASGYLTGGQVKTVAGGKTSNSTKLSELGIDSGTIMAGDTKIALSGDMSLAKLTSSLKSAGITANFDDSTGRFFLSSKNSGADYEFTVTAGDAEGVEALSKLGLLSFTDTNGEETAELQRYREMATDTFDAEAEVNSRYEKAKWTDKSYKTFVSNKVNDASDAIETAKKSIEAYQKQLDKLNEDDYDWKDDYKTEEEFNKAKETIQKKIDDNNASIEKNQKIVDEYKPYLDDAGMLSDKVKSLNADILSDIQNLVNKEIATAKDVVNRFDSGLLGNAVNSARISAKDSIIKLNGAEFTSNTNSYSINGLNINATSVTTTTSLDENGNTIENDNAVVINTTVDVDGIYNKIRSLFSAYNEMISSIDGMYYADSSEGYEPLTDDEKEAMTDKQIEEWEEKIKTALLRKDSTLGSISSSLKSAILGTGVTVNGKSYTLASFGIATSSYFNTTGADRGKFHIDGDSEDSATSSNADKLRAAISADPDGVIQFFQNLSQNMYDTLTKKMASSSVSSAFTIYNDKQMSSQYSDYKTKIEDWEERLEKYEESYYKKFSAMETALSKLQSQTNSLSNLFGGNQ
ncbi:MAG: flagellar filament capping protein FliD [Butyrivibrio sp.]